MEKQNIIITFTKKIIKGRQKETSGRQDIKGARMPEHVYSYVMVRNIFI